MTIAAVQTAKARVAPIRIKLKVSSTFLRFVFFISNSDEGMPPRRSRQPEQIPVEEPMDTPEEEPVQYEQIPVVEAEIVEDPE